MKLSKKSGTEIIDTMILDFDLISKKNFTFGPGDWDTLDIRMQYKIGFEISEQT
jgi:hypothetical protein